MKPKIIDCPQITVMGISIKMQQGENQKIKELWQQFSPIKYKINNTINDELIAMQIFTIKVNSQPASKFNMWACVEVSNFNNIPKDMQSYTIPSGKYAVFLHKGMDAGATYQRIMTEWLPNSGYQIDDRPHFQIMGSKYKNGSPDSEEDFYVPITDSLN